MQQCIFKGFTVPSVHGEANPPLGIPRTLTVMNLGLKPSVSVNMTGGVKDGLKGWKLRPLGKNGNETSMVWTKLKWKQEFDIYGGGFENTQLLLWVLEGTSGSMRFFRRFVPVFG